jgi:aminoglycoside phosphotransferase
MPAPNTVPSRPPSWFSLRDGIIIYQHGSRIVWKIRNDLILKRVLADPHLSEAATHDFLRSETSLPVPRVYAEWLSLDQRYHYLLESQIPGVSLLSCWTRLSTATKLQLARTVTAYMTQLTRFRSPRMQSVSGTRLPNNLFAPDDPTNTTRRREHLRGRWASDTALFEAEFLPPLTAAGVPRSLVRSLRRTMPPCVSQLMFTHCDLYLGNVMVDPARGTVTAVIDWESAGFWPAWFQYARVTHGCNDEDTQWKYMLGRLMRDAIPYAEQGRVWWDAVHTLVVRPDSAAAREWVGLLVRYAKGEERIEALRAYQGLTGEGRGGRGRTAVAWDY